MTAVAIFGCVFLMALVQLPVDVRCDSYNNNNSNNNRRPSPSSSSSSSSSSSPFVTSSGMYISSYDHIDVNRLLKNDKLVTAYIKCFLGDGPCTTDGRQVKTYLLPEIVNTVCSKCSPRQKTMARQVMRYVYNTRPNDFNRLIQMYDKTNKYAEIIRFMNSSE